MSWISWRYKTAFSFGRKEHLFSRILFAGLLATLGVYWLVNRKIDLVFLLLCIDIILWMLYWTCHRLEKLAYPNNAGVRH